MPDILTIAVADDLPRYADRLKRAELRLQLSGAAPEEVVEVKLNGVTLPAPKLGAEGWRTYPAMANPFALGKNLLFIRMLQRAANAKTPVAIEKCEIQVSWN